MEAVLKKLPVALLLLAITWWVAYEYMTLDDRDEAWDILGIWVVALGVGLVQFLLLRWRHSRSPIAQTGVLLILYPPSLLAWLSDAGLWFIVPFALIGVLILWHAGSVPHPLVRP